MGAGKRLFQNGSIATADSAELLAADVLVDESGVIVEIGRGLTVGVNMEVIDCTACVLVPGMFDLHVHSREPGYEHKETLASCAAAALHGGVTGLVLMPDTSPPVDSGNLVKSAMDLVSENSPIPMFQSGCLTKGRAGTELAGFSGMASRGVPMLTDADRAVPCPDLMRRCMEYAKDFDLLVTSHCVTPSLAKAGAMNEGRISYQLGLPGIPAISQEIAIDRDIRIAQHTGARLHLQQISTARGLKSVACAKEAGTDVSCEVSAHHLVLNETDIRDYNTHFKCNPPLTLPSDNEALVQGLIEGTIDLIASDHAPHTEFEKSSDFGSAPFGASGLETTVLVLHDRFLRRGTFGWDLLIQRYSVAPRQRIGLAPVSIQVGQPAEFFVFDPNAETVITREYLRTRSPVSPFLGETLTGAMRGTAMLDSWFC
ncbi:MAG TPA: dihydroorotase [Verrucomicrobiales bacterium]|jgi:dihydroorotase|nr:dihydroorotase [Verrucomicrobiales bacterium]